MVNRSRQYRDGEVAAVDFSLDQISEHIQKHGDFVWYDLVKPRPEDLQVLAAELGLHNLAIEDAMHGRQRPKVDHYENHLFINVYQGRLHEGSDNIDTFEVGIFVTKHALITVRQTEEFDIESIVARWDESVALAKNGVAFLLWGLLDQVIDGYFEVIERLDERLEKLEDVLFGEERRDVAIQRQTYDLRKSLVLLRRAAVPMREVINPLLKHNGDILHNDMMPYYQDLYDHTMRVADWTDSLRDLVTTLLETHLTIQSNRMNMVMKKVTSWAAIIAVPTAITGFYGQNVPYPGFANEWGFWTSTIAIVVISGALYLGFKKRDWL
jgi:magnesium transporter